MNGRSSALIPLGIIVAIALAEVIESFTFGSRFAKHGDPGPSAVPLGVGLAVIALCLVEALRRDHGEPWPRRSGVARITTVIVLMIAYGYTMSGLGFLVATLLFLFAALLVGGVKNWIALTAIPILSSLGIYLIFDKVLAVILPAGLTQGML